MAIERARSGDGPCLVENVSYRWRGHSKSDANRYRTREEIEEWKQKDPIARLQARIKEDGAMDETGLDAVRDRAYAAINSAVAFADASPEPSLDTIEEGVYA
jgi:pyruvate dehydrogenase E1 component alpha subunit